MSNLLPANENVGMKLSIPQEFTIETARCRLRRPSVADLAAVFAATQVTGFNDGMQWEPPQTIAELEEPLRQNLRDWDEGVMFGFTIADLHTDRLLGRIGIRQTSRVDVWNLGFWTHPDYQGRGYMTESTIAILAFGFDRLNAMQIEASYALWNKSSKRVLEKVGMRFVKYVPHAFQKKGRWIEANKMRISHKEWLALTNNAS